MATPIIKKMRERGEGRIEGTDEKQNTKERGEMGEERREVRKLNQRPKTVREKKHAFLDLTGKS